jgi:RNA polymerase sigma-70 factor (ECF subfamily)
MTMAPTDGSDLMIRFSEGDETAFEQLVRKYEQEMLNYFYRLTRRKQAAEDLTQELFLRVLRYKETYKPQSSFKYFLYRLARNLWIDRYRKQKIRPRVLPLDVRPRGREEGQPALQDSLKSDDRGPQRKAVLQENVAKLEEAIEQLTDKQKDVIALCFEGGLKYQEIAEIIQVPLGTVKSRIHSAVMRLKELMGEMG